MLSLDLKNLFGDRERVTDRIGRTPAGFFPNEIDPLGRTLRLSLRKLFQ